MLRNLGILKMRLCLPIRSLQYSTGPWDVSRTASATITIGSISITAATKATTKTNRHFTYEILVRHGANLHRLKPTKTNPTKKKTNKKQPTKNHKTTSRH